MVVIRTRQKLENGDIKMRALVWPAMVYSGKIAGEHFNPQLVQNGLFEGYLLERVSDFLLDQLIFEYSSNLSLSGDEASLHRTVLRSLRRQ